MRRKSHPSSRRPMATNGSRALVTRSFTDVCLISGAVLSAVLASPAHAEQAIPTRVMAGEFRWLGRITFQISEDVPGQGIVGDNSILVHFTRPVAADISAVTAALPRYVTRVERSGDDFIIH